MDTKMCLSCGMTKPAQQFYNYRARLDGLTALCKTCFNARAAEYRMRPPRIKTPPGTKRCTLCKTIKPNAEFSNNRSYHDGLDRSCKACSNARASAYHRTHRETINPQANRRYHKNAERYADYSLKRRLGLARGQYNAMLAGQGGKCAICGSTDPGPRTKRFHVDHNHTTGQIRGLLCQACNHGIGLFGEDTDRIRQAIQYLLHYPTT